jgi:glycosyltransferase involved in cell wall biosynthesis
MKILFAMAHPYLPEFSGGIQSSTHELAQGLISRGHEVAVLANLIGAGLAGYRTRIARKLLRRQAIVDNRVGYPVYRTWFAWDAAAELIDLAKPDVVVVQPRLPVRLAKAFEHTNVPVVLYIRDVEFRDHGGDMRDLSTSKFIANSKFTADRYFRAFGIESTVIPPLVNAEHYRVVSRRKNVTFINPHPEKGVDLAIQIAEQCPDIPFSFVESWTLKDDYKAELRRRLAKVPNVTLLPRTDDMRTIYGDARIMLVPSKWEEAWGRVVSEAHFSGIPALAASTGGLPESVGPGGVVMSQDAPVTEWVGALRKLWSDVPYYNSLAAAALTYAWRKDLNADYQMATLIGVLQGAISERRASAPC